MYRYLKLIFTMLLISFTTMLNGQDTRAQEEKKARLEREIAIIDKQLAENASQSSSMLSDLNLVRKKIANRKSLVAETDRRVRQYSDSIYLTQKEINRLQARVDTLTGHYSRLVFADYSVRQIVSVGECLGTVQVMSGVKETVQLLAAADFSYALTANEQPELVLSKPDFVYAPVVHGQDAGFAYVCLNGKPVGKIPLIYGESVEMEEIQKPSRWEKLLKGGKR